MISQCAYCKQDTAGNHEWNCPAVPNPIKIDMNPPTSINQVDVQAILGKLDELINAVSNLSKK